MIFFFENESGTKILSYRNQFDWHNVIMILNSIITVSVYLAHIGTNFFVKNKIILCHLCVAS